MRRLNSSIKTNTVGGAIAGGLIGSLFGDTTGEKIACASVGAILGDIISDEIENKYSSRISSYDIDISEPIYISEHTSFSELKREIDKESRNILATRCEAYKKRNALEKLKDRVNSRFYASDIDYFQKKELISLIDTRIELV